MARRRDVEVATGLRAEVAAELREAHAEFGVLRLVDDPDRLGETRMVSHPGPSTWSRQADALDAGEPVVLRGRDARRWDPEVDAQALVRLDPDGTITPVERHGYP